MEFSHVALGLATGVPLMIVVGPIALLLIDQGLRRGLRAGGPAAVGVATADLVFSSGAALAGVAAARVLEPAEPVLRYLALGVLCLLAARLWRAARAELSVAARIGTAVPVPVGAPVPTAGPTPAAPGPRGVGHSIVVQGGPVALAGAFFVATAVNPITIVVFTSLVVGGGDGVGSSGWVLGMTAASLLVNTSFVAIGHGLGAVLDEVATARLRMVGAALILLLALHLALA